MKISQIVESSTTSGAIASVPMGTGSMQRRAGGSMFKGKKTNKFVLQKFVEQIA